MSHRQGRRVNHERDVQEYVRMDRTRSPAASTAGSDLDYRGLDEIALLKRGMINKDGDVLKREMRKPAHIEQQKPITLQELTERGLKFENGQVIYSLPEKSASSKTSKASSSKKSKSNHSLSDFLDDLSICPSNETIPPIRGMSHESLIETPMCTTTYRVGLPEEKAILKLGDTNEGKRYDLSTPDFQLMMQISKRNTVILLYKD